MLNPVLPSLTVYLIPKGGVSLPSTEYLAMRHCRNMPEQRFGACEQLPELIVERLSLRSQKAGIPKSPPIDNSWEFCSHFLGSYPLFFPEGLNSYSLVKTLTASRPPPFSF